MSRLKDIEIKQAGEAGNRMVRVKSWAKLGAIGRSVVTNEEGEITHIFAPNTLSIVQEFPRTIKHLCGQIVEIDREGRVMTYFGKNRCTGGELSAASHFMLSPWMYEEIETPDPYATTEVDANAIIAGTAVAQRLKHNEEHQRKKVEPRLGPCLSCGEIKLLDIEGAMGECRDCLHASRKSFETDIAKVLENIKEILLEKNRKYGDSALNPSRIFAKSDAVEQINVRIDDKLKRIQNRQDDEDEDVETDLLGYLVLLKIAKGGEA